MVIVGDIIGNGGDLRFRTRERIQFQGKQRVECGNTGCFETAFSKRSRKRPIMLGDALQTLPGQIQPVVTRITVLQTVQNANGLVVVIESAERCHRNIQRLFARMAERRMPEIMCQRERFGQVFIQS